jgi:hypothetical protein
MTRRQILARLIVSPRAMPDPLSDVILKAYQPAVTAPLNLFLLSSAKAKFRGV